ncbi:MAG: transposase [Candidatus Pacebacteria bacterium]|nr:transposase [Candidatus Paceibacterota bacterium]
MPIKRPTIINGEMYHIVIRAIEGLLLFKDESDYYRMIHDLFEFNDENPAKSSHRYPKTIEKRSRQIEESRQEKRKLLVEILAFCLMPNHVHLLVRQLRENGISKFTRKLGAGYGLYYNKKYNRQGHVFQGRYRIVHIQDNNQLQTVFVYIHTNPVSLIIPKWREKGIGKKQLKKVINFLENEYRWSSYPDYLEIKNFPSLTSREFLTKIMNGKEGSREFVNGWLIHKKELADLEKISIE